MSKCIEEEICLLLKKLKQSDEENNTKEECCVCFEKNEVKTSCKHNLCRPCHSKLEWNEEEDEDEKFKLCPMCRCRLFNRKYDE
jgi:hypothetical protein